MKAIKLLIISIIILVIFYFASYKSEKVNIEGSWTTEKIILQGEQLYPTKIDSFINLNRFNIQISEWTDSLYLFNGREIVGTGFTIKKSLNGKHTIRLSSRENSLNGNFDLEIDTIRKSHLDYKVNIKIQNKTTLLQFHREVLYKPRKPDLPRRGKP